MLDRELRVAREAIRRAGEAILLIGEEDYPEAPEEAHRSVVTKADIEADRILQEALLGAFPGDGWLSEETREDPRRFSTSRVWIVDPIDGTREFVMKNPEFVVSVALVEAGKAILGVVYNPATDELFEAVSGGGTRLNGEPVRCDRAAQERLRVEVSRSDISKGRFLGFEADLELRPCGSIAYKLARVAAGWADAALSVTPKNEWDIAAGVLLVEEAGGRAGDLSGAAYRFNRADTLVDGVIAGHAQTCSALKDLVERIADAH